ncbi:transcriptional regulator [Streptomyces nigrescens]|uniref:transcriptional regulator n=1 Tax=Streptomyces nigrescens TaxID=1920 RepID=UPI00224FE0C3|nr:transcriptional regulator [Streptomyces libani]MCX5449838.1 transcriptional regulator [Streptomyces libani]MCX5451159.1 transcriptional regulator [Streptomyces libani]
MLAMPSGTPACPEDDRQHRLAAQLADMIPGAATIRVSLNDPQQAWPHLHAIVKDEAGETLKLGRNTARVAARWILRVWPEADWSRPHVFDLADATLTRSDAVVDDRGC